MTDLALFLQSFYFILFYLFIFWLVCSIVSKSCVDTYKPGESNSGVYTINPDGSGIIDVFCD